MIYIVLLLALLLRLININQSFWLDEAITATIARNFSIGHIFTNYFPLDNSPALYLLLINFLFSVFPNTELVDRLPSVLAGIGTIYFVYLIGKKIINQNHGLLAAVLLTTSSLHVYYSQEGRMYALTAFFASAMVWFFLNYLDTKKIKYLAGLTLFSVLILHTHYLSGLMLLVTNALALRFKIFDRRWIVSQLVIGFSFLLWLPWFIKQLNLGIAGRGVSQVFDQVLGKFDPKTLPLTFEKFTLGRIPVGDNYPLIFIIIPMLIFGVILLLGVIRSDVKSKTVILTWLGLPLALATLISLKLPVFLHYRVLFVLPAFYLLLVLGIFNLPKKLKPLLIGIVLVINVIALGIYYYDPYLQREQWKQSIDWVIPQIKEGDKVLFAGADPPAPYLWYRPAHPETLAPFNGFYVADTDQERVASQIKNSTRLFVFNYLQDITDPNKKLQQWIEENGFKKRYEVSYIGIGKIEVYER